MNIKEWILTIAVCAVIIEIFDILMPEGSTHKTAFIVCGLILSLCMIMPVSSIYKNLKLVNFNYSSDRQNIIQNRDKYTEDQIMEITTDFKQKLKKHTQDLVLSLKNISDCKVEVVIEEDYNQDNYGQIYRIYVVAQIGKENQKKKNESGFNDYGKIEKIEIRLEGINIKERDKKENEEAENENVKDIKNLISDEFKIDKNYIFAEVNE